MGVMKKMSLDTKEIELSDNHDAYDADSYPSAQMVKPVNTFNIKVTYSDNEETGWRKYDFENMKEQFEEKMKELEIDAEERYDAFQEKQQDYALDNMTCDEQEEEK
jgi:hypothetical protein